jgi:diacylglycerol kinase (ATP)
MSSARDSTARRIALSFRYAFEGVAYVLRTQRNARIHGLISIGVVILGLWLQISATQWAVLVLAMMVVWVSEFLNTSLEAFVDLISPERKMPAKIAKDVAAAAVLVGAIGAIIVGLLVLGPPLIEKVF